MFRLQQSVWFASYRKCGSRLAFVGPLRHSETHGNPENPQNLYHRCINLRTIETNVLLLERRCKLLFFTFFVLIPFICKNIWVMVIKKGYSSALCKQQQRFANGH